MPSLFDDLARFDRDRLATRLSSLAQQQMFIGTSSWKYPGWLDQIYSRERYTNRGRFSRKRFEAECITEYADVFPTVCGDFAFYQFPTADFWANLFRRVPPSFQFAFKVPELITAASFAKLPRFGAHQGARNPDFLNAEMLKTQFLDLLVSYKDQVGVLIFEFGTSAKSRFEDIDSFLKDLAPFLSQLQKEFRFAIEIRNQEFLEPVLFQLLRNEGIAYVFNSWTRMPPLPDQLAIEDAYTTDFSVVRALLKPGRFYEQAVELFSPYQTVQAPLPEIRASLQAFIRSSKDRKQTTYIYVNNRLEGNAPETIEAILDVD